MADDAPLTLDDLRRIDLIRDVPAEELTWLLPLLRTWRMSPGDEYIHFGQPVHEMAFLLEGELAVVDETGGPIWILHAGEVFGVLPYSRMRVSPGTGRAMRDSWVTALHRDHMPRLIRESPTLVQRLVWTMLDRTRETTRDEQQREKLVALGKLAAGLAHELNNPSAAIKRDAAMLCDVLGDLERATERVHAHCLGDAARTAAQSLVEALADERLDLDALERSDREDTIALWLRRHGMPNGEMAAQLADRLSDVKVLDAVSAGVPADALREVIQRATAVATVRSIVDNLAAAATRVSDLVSAVKEYAYMDRVAAQPTDIHTTIELTLKMFAHRLKRAVTVERRYAPDLPLVQAHPGELSQVWTNLIDNALDAMSDAGQLVIETARDGAYVWVAVQDSGPGIPQSIQSHIFEPFFTTKRVGEGTGLGLDVVYGIVERHQGTIRLESEPGRTRFIVRLPVTRDEKTPASVAR